MSLKRRQLLAPLIWLTLLLVAVYRFEWLTGVFFPFIKAKSALRERAPLSFYMLQHLELVGISTLFSLLAGLALGVATRFAALRAFRQPLLQAATFLQTLPSVAILALCVPLLGYGQAPVVIALVVYGLLPILRNVIEGLDAVSPDVILSAAGMGMSPWQRLVAVEWPLALPAVFAGVKTSVVINISAATIGAAMGAGGLGILIVNGIRTMDVLMILKGALPVSLLALFVNNIFTLLEQRWFRRR
ncbi:MAG: ABC transporter permease [Christensenellales bacterium]